MELSVDEIFRQLIKGTVKIYKLEELTDKSTAISLRRKYIEHKLNLNLESISKFSFDPDKIFSRNCENVIGGATLPVGVAGPILVRGDDANGEYFVPIATTEGALVASVNRGAKLINLSGGATTISTYVGITRAPLYRLESIRKAREFVSWVMKNLDVIRSKIQQSDKFIDMIDLTPYTNGKNVWLRIQFNTKDAMGMNMAVVATKHLSDWMESQFDGLRTVAISGNLCVDKKPASINIIEGRGRIVEAEVTISKKTIINELNTTVEKIVEVNRNKIWVGGHMSGSLGFNAHVANVVAGVFIATGQDPAHVVGGSMASTTMETTEDGDLYAHVRIPELNVATFGGGTMLSDQSQLRDLMIGNLSQELTEPENVNNTNKFAEVLGAACLAGEISLLAAFANDGFVKAHTDLGRNGKSK
jgi:hydroxymethylglutaryl-CoA reductase (NADPH)